eukprot:scaffold37189_cov31-Tisochrysis_lutea.AAC.4
MGRRGHEGGLAWRQARMRATYLGNGRLTSIVEELLGVEVIGEDVGGEPRKLLLLHVDDGKRAQDVHVVEARLVKRGARGAAQRPTKALAA